MPAGLATRTNGQAALWLNGEPAWHRLGKVWTEEDGAITVDKVLDQAGLDFQVETRPLFFGATPESKMGAERTTEGHTFATVRNDTNQQLGTVGNIYKPYQNREAFSFLSELTGQSDATFESAGLLANGARVFVTMKLGDDLVLDPAGVADTIRKYAVVTNAHNGTGKVTTAVTPVRIVCTNTLNYGLKAATSKLEVRHTEGGLNRLADVEEAARQLKLTRKFWTEFENDATALLAQKMTDKQFERFLEQVVFPIKATDTDRMKDNQLTRRETAQQLWRNAETVAPVKGTRWGALQALTEQFEHHWESNRVPKSLRLDESIPRTLQEQMAKGAKVIAGSKDDEDRKSNVHRALLTWGR